MSTKGKKRSLSESSFQGKENEAPSINGGGGSSYRGIAGFGSDPDDPTQNVELVTNSPFLKNGDTCANFVVAYPSDNPDTITYLNENACLGKINGGPVKCCGECTDIVARLQMWAIRTGQRIVYGSTQCLPEEAHEEGLFVWVIGSDVLEDDDEEDEEEAPGYDEMSLDLK